VAQGVTGNGFDQTGGPGGGFDGFLQGTAIYSFSEKDFG